ncbi:Gamma-soluble NSF attachment protein [Entamoeba marina]
MSNQKRKEAEKHVQEAEKHLKTGLFKWSSDYSLAAASFEKAANSYKGQLNFKEACDCRMKAADCYYKEKLQLPSARQYEQAAEMAQKAENWKLMKECSEKAAKNYEDTAQTDRIPQCHMKTANALEYIDKPEALKMYQKAIDLFVEMKKTMFIGQGITKAVGFGIKNELYKETQEFLESAIAAFAAMKQESEINRCRLTQILLLMINKDLEGASNLLDDPLETFIGSDQKIFAARFLDAYEGGDVKTFETLKDNVNVRFLNPEVMIKVKEIEIPEELVNQAKQEKQEKYERKGLQIKDEYLNPPTTSNPSNFDVDFSTSTKFTLEQMVNMNSMTETAPQQHIEENYEDGPMREEDMDALL